MTTKNAICGQCGAEHTLEKRVVTEICGHQKCRHCFLQEEHFCYQCERTKDNNGKKEDALNVKKTEKYLEKIPGNSESNLVCDISHSRQNGQKRQEYSEKHQCSQCLKEFSKLSYLKHHLDTHSSLEHHCSHCHKVFGNRLILRKHENLHRSQPHPCLYCGKVLRSKDTLKVHIASKHTRLLDHKCMVCPKAYASKSALNQHLLKHQSRRYYCQLCNKSYQRNSTLKSHIKRHNNIELHQCSKCWKSFSDRISFKRHEKQHQNSPKFRCKHCEIITMRKDNMLRHVRNFHANFTFEESVDKVEFSVPNLLSSKVNEKTIKSSSLKTVENSSVIKCVGNVEPVTIPLSHNKEKKSTSTNEKSTFDNAVNNLEFHHNITKRQTFNLELYRRILDDSDTTQQGLERPTNETNANNLLTNEHLIEEKRTPLHWRKSFKNSYELREF